MLGLIIWLVICFTWLLYETDWMRVRLLVGAPLSLIGYGLYTDGKKLGEITKVEGSTITYKPSIEED